MRSDRELRKLYKKYNRKYFRGRLPANTVVRFAKTDKPDDLGHVDMETGEPADIVINKKLKPFRPAVRGTLIHEMAHLHLDITGHTRHDHGEVFDKEMNRVAKLGAFDWFSGERIW